MIVRDEEDVLQRCLDGVNLFADELIVVDTGSADATKQIAARYTEQVYDYAWDDDFSAARNDSYRFATCDYVMWMDADDVIDAENAAKINRLKRVATEFPQGFEMLYDIPENGCIIYSLRMVRRDVGPIWTGALHESIDLHGSIVDTDITILHRKLRTEDHVRNIRIIRKLLHENIPISFHIQSNGWLDCYLAGETELADKLYRLCRHQAKQGDCVGLKSSLLIADVLCNREQYNAALQWYTMALSQAKGSTLAAFAVFQQITKCCARLGRWSEARLYNEMALELRPGSRSARLNRISLERSENGISQ